MGCKNSKELNNMIYEVKQVLQSIDRNDIQQVENFLTLAWSVYEGLSRHEKDEVKILSKKYFNG